MLNLSIEILPIGVIATPFKFSKGTPLQPIKSDVVGEAKLFDEFAQGFESLDGFSHIILLYWCHKTTATSMMIKPYLDTRSRGIFSTRAPSRPNPIGISVVELVQIEGNAVRFKGADMLNESPLLDIKPFIPEVDNRSEASSGWLSGKFNEQNSRYTADDRFEKNT